MLRKIEINMTSYRYFEINFVLENIKTYHVMAAAQVAKKLKDKRKQRTIEGIFKKVGSVTIKLILYQPTLFLRRNGLIQSIGI